MNEQLALLETQLDDLGAKRFALYAALPLLMLYLGWVLAGEELSGNLAELGQQNVELTEKIAATDPQKVTTYIAKTRQETLELNERIDTHHFSHQYLLTKLDTAELVFFDQHNYTAILEDILKRSVSLSLNVEGVHAQSVDSDPADMLTIRRRIVIEGDGAYRPLLSLAQYVESLNALIEVANITISQEETQTPRFALTLDFYGVAL